MDQRPARTPIPALDRIRDAARAVAEASNPSLRLVVLFGSVARADPAPADIDLGLLGNGPLDLLDAANRFTRALGTNAIDVVDLRRANPVLLMAVAREGIPLFDETGIGFGEFSSLAMRRYADTKKFRDAVREDLRDYVSGGNRAR
jgi:predicted nucleotidyltransferase